MSSPPQDPKTRADSAGFSVSARVRAKAESSRVFERGRRVSHPLLALHVLFEPVPDADRADGTAGARLGLAVSRKVDRRAHERNRIKRVLREAFRLQRARLTPGAYVVLARVPARAATNPALRAAFVSVLERAGALPPSDAPGTMPAPPRPASPRPA